MLRYSEKVRVGARLADTISLIDTPEKAKALLSSGIEGVFQYLGSVTPAVVQNVLSNELGFMPVTFANQFDGIRATAEMKALGVPPGTSAWLDVEACGSMDPTMLKGKINAWAGAMSHAGFIPGLYVGEGCLLTSEELFALGVVRYWASPSDIKDRFGQLARPSCLYCCHQLYPSVLWGGVTVDIDFVREDALGRLPAWAKAK
jgi:hypothetical protein